MWKSVLHDALAHEISILLLRLRLHVSQPRDVMRLIRHGVHEACHGRHEVLNLLRGNHDAELNG